MVSRAFGKKAVFFTFTAVLLLGVLLLSFSVYSRYTLRTKSMLIETRVLTMDSFIKDLEKDATRGLYISSHRSILTMVQHITSTGKFVDSAETRFNEVIFNGTINGTAQALIANTTLTDWMQKMKLQGNKIDLTVNFTVQSLEIGMASPWEVEVKAEMGILVSDALGTASWNTTRNLTAKVGIEGFEDPVYAVKTGGRVLNTIEMTPFEDFVVSNDTSNLIVHANNSYYVAWSTGPDFLMRMEGNLNSSDYGIESIINLDALSQQGITVQEKSAVDHIYWSSKAVSSYSIEGMPSWFMMDDEYNNNTGETHLQLYQVEGLVE